MHKSSLQHLQLCQILNLMNSQTFLLSLQVVTLYRQKVVQRFIPHSEAVHNTFSRVDIYLNIITLQNKITDRTFNLKAINVRS
jgi:hypothetical protein